MLTLEVVYFSDQLRVVVTTENKDYIPISLPGADARSFLKQFD